MSPDDLDAIELPTVGFLREIPQELHPTTLAVLKAAKAQLWDGQVWDLEQRFTSIAAWCSRATIERT